jgi:predicted Zn-dependent peptidase
VTYNAQVDGVSAEDVRASAARYLARDDTRIVVVGDASKIAAGLRTLDAGDVVVR